MAKSFAPSTNTICSILGVDKNGGGEKKNHAKLLLTKLLIPLG
jgi:hypothetical protein